MDGNRKSFAFQLRIQGEEKGEILRQIAGLFVLRKLKVAPFLRTLYKLIDLNAVCISFSEEICPF